jgi:RecB family exonuclease
MDIKYISVSTADAWRTCALRWALSREHKIAEEEKGTALRYGSAVHAYAAYTAVVAHGAICEDAERCAFDPVGSPYPPGYAQRWVADAQWVRTMLATLVDEWYSLEVERKIEMPLPLDGLTYTGFIDLLCTKPGEVLIADWKTGKRRSHASESLQLCCYSAWARHNGLCASAVCELLYFDGEVRSRTQFTDDRMDAALALLTETAAEIRNTPREAVRPTPGKHCQWCDYADRCPQSSVGCGYSNYGAY